MRIAINCRSILLDHRTGIGRYSYNLLDCLGQIDKGNSFLLYAPKRCFDFKRRLPLFPYKNFKPLVDLFNAGPQRLFKKVDLYHLPSPQVIEQVKKVKLVVTVHDLIYKTYPQSHTPETLQAAQRQMEFIVRYADKIICVSQSTRTDLHRFFNLPLEKTCVIYNGVDRNLFYPLDESQRILARERLKCLGINQRFILFVGTVEPRKNLTGLLHSFALLKSEQAFTGQLVVAGMKGWMIQGLEELIKQLGIAKDVIFTGFVRDDQLRELYNLAEVFVFPSFYEGFGFPIVEAFCCGAATVTSDNSSCGEIASDAALTVTPKTPSQIAQGIIRLLEDKVFNQYLRQKAIRRASEFSFIQTARETLKIYERIVP